MDESINRLIIYWKIKMNNESVSLINQYYWRIDKTNMYKNIKIDIDNGSTKLWKQY